MDAFAKLSAALQTLIDLEPEVTRLQGNLTDQQYEDLYDLFDKAERGDDRYRGSAVRDRPRRRGRGQGRGQGLPLMLAVGNAASDLREADLFAIRRLATVMLTEGDLVSIGSRDPAIAQCFQ